MIGNVPWHPAVVHLPVALCVLMPLLAAAALLAWWRGWLPGRRLWVGVVALQALLLAGTLVAQRTGEQEEEQVEKVVAEDPIHEHEEAAEAFVAGSGVVLALAGAALLLPREGLRRAAALVAVLGMLAVLGLGYRTAKAGGELVYEHGAAAAYVDAGAIGAADAAAVDAQEPEEDDD